MTKRIIGMRNPGNGVSAFPRRRKLARLLASGTIVLGTALTGSATSAGAADNEGLTPAAPLACDDGLKAAMGGAADTTVLLVKAFRQGEPLALAGAASAAASTTAVEGAANAPPPTAGTDMCLVKLLVGPGNPGPAGAPSTSAGIGIEVLLPSHAEWNGRIRAYGNSGWSGTPQASLAQVAGDDLHAAAAAKGFVVATSDNGHVGSPIDASFAMNPDGSVNTVGWKDFSQRSLHEVAEKTKALAKLYYGRPHEFAYWDGFSTGGRQGLKIAQAFPGDFDGILVGAPAINWTRYHTAGLYAQIAMKQELGELIAPEKLDAVTKAAISACGGAELGFLIDPLSCRYDPTQDAALLCKGSSGEPTGSAAGNPEACLTKAEAGVVNKIWYGQTIDGSAPDPARDNGNANDLSDERRLWFGWTRDTDLKATPAGGAPGIILAADQTALEMQDPTLGSDLFANATGKGANRWLDTLDYAGLATAQARGVELQPQFSDINTDNPDLSAFDAAGGKVLMYQGLSDEYIPAQGSISYYESVMSRIGGAQAVQEFFRSYLIPGFTHSGRSEGLPNVPVPQPVSGRDEMFLALQDWVENGEAPGTIEATSSDGSVSLPLCVYPLKTTYKGTGSVKSAESYACY
ncbi:tannase/feruloyl esterase family alpha/beta hydrolase [Mongoliimonas terrestris]|uniref:tannase/feruloyl esterase family alpha/beta hydrolase n=1 Tax=Mongoliimonas terrestris TaxID=1709001 RepID=UPI000AAD3D58|nr:tannase/feruloyl esterase family alpha/beta hydrolase [Mongoliimonas terrestris]